MRPHLSGLLDFDFIWASFFSLPPITLQSGESLTTHYDLVLNSAHFDGEGRYEKGSIFDGGVDCTVTAA